MPMALSLPADNGFPAAAASWAIHFGEMATDQLLVLFGILAWMACWVWLFGVMVSGSTRAATSYLSAWCRVIKWTIVAGMVLSIAVLQISPG
jgi:hypothetical protein